MKRVLFGFVLCLMCFPQDAAAIVADLNKNHVDISVGFAGEELTIFGTQTHRGPLAIVVQGPRREAIVRKKSRVMGAWMNTHAIRFKDVPLFYEYAVLNDAVNEEYNIKPEGLKPVGKHVKEKDLKIFREALIRNKQENGYYTEQPVLIQRYGDTGLFRADIKIPSNVPVGEYRIEVFENGSQEPSVTKTFMVAQTGGNARIKYFAKNQSFIYGAGCIAFALFAGWFSNRVRRRT